MTTASEVWSGMEPRADAVLHGNSVYLKCTRCRGFEGIERFERFKIAGNR